MFESIKKLFINKNFVPFNDAQGGDFYSLMNSNYSVRELSRSDYLRLYTGWVYVATSTISDSIAELEYQTKVGEKEKDHRYNSLVTYEFLKKVSSFMLLNGNCFVYKQMIGSKVDSLAILRPDLVTLEQSADGSLLGYRYNGYRTNALFRPDEIINFEMFSPFETFPGKVKGVSPMHAIAMQAEMDGTANRWNWNFFKNGGSVRDILSTDQVIKQENKDRLLSKWKANYQGVNNAHKIAILDQGLKYESIAPSQKEMDFVESRRFTRDEILAIYKIPKIIIGIMEDANKASAVIAENTYARVCLRPLAKLIAQTLTKDLYKGEVQLEFINIVPKDTEQLSSDLNNGAISVNEYRKERGYLDIKNGELLKLNEFNTMPTDGDKEEVKQNEYSGIVRKAIQGQIKGTPEYKAKREEQGQKKWGAKIIRTDKYEAKMIKEINNIFAVQEADILKDIVKSAKKEPNLNDTKYKTMWTSALTPLFKDIMQKEGNEALAEIGISTMFDVGNTDINKWIRDNVKRIAKDVDDTTKTQIFDIIDEGNAQGLGSTEIARNITKKFESFKESRSRTIARTEITNASTKSDISAWESSEVVIGKEWYTALDERVCPSCGPMHGKIVGLKEDFFKKGQVAPGGLKIDYMDIIGPALHPDDRCVLLPIIK